MNLTIKLTDVRGANYTAGELAALAQPLLICDRCQNVEEIVVATMEILQLEETWALCGTCAHELPNGFKLA